MNIYWTEATLVIILLLVILITHTFFFILFFLGKENMHENVSIKYDSTTGFEERLCSSLNHHCTEGTICFAPYNEIYRALIKAFKYHLNKI